MIMADEHGDDNCLCRLTEKMVWLEFVDTTTINGLSRLVTKNKIRRGIWTGLVLATFICFGCHFYFMLGNYLEYPLNTQSSIQEEGFIFPDVTICAINPFDSNKTTEKQIGIKRAEEFWYYLIKKANTSEPVNEMVVRTLANEKADLSFSSYESHEGIYLDILDRIHYCVYNEKKCFKSDFSQSYMKEYLNCITFHPADRSLNSEGRDSGLHLIMDDGFGFSSSSEFEELYQSNGYEVTIHENGTEPNFKKQLFFTQSGREHDISMSMSKYQKLATPKKPCLDEIITDEWAVNMHAPPKDRMFYRRTRDTCKMLEFQRTSTEKCGCWRDDFLIPFSESFGKGMPLCHELPESVFYNDALDIDTGKITYNGTEVDVSVGSPIFEEIKNRYGCFKDFKATTAYNNLEHCIHNCESISYDANMAVSDYKFNIDNYLKLYDSIFKKFKMRKDDTPTDLEKLRKELGDGDKVLTIKVYPVDLDVMLTEESLAYDLISFFSDFGGNIGLWIGCTVVTLAEVFELFIRLAYVKIKRSRLENQPNGSKKTDGEKGKEDPEAINLTTTT